MIKDGVRAAFYKPTNFEIPLISIADLNKIALLRIFNYIKGGFVGISNYNINDTKEIYEEREHFFKAFFNIIDYKFLEISSYNPVHFFESIIVVPTMISDKIDVDYLRNVMRILCKSSKQDHYIYFNPKNNSNDLCMWCNKYGEEIPPNNDTNSYILNKFQFFVENLLKKNFNIIVGMGDELKMKAHPPLKGIAIKNDKNEIYNEFTAYTKAEYREILKNESEGSKE